MVFFRTFMSCLISTGIAFDYTYLVVYGSVVYGIGHFHQALHPLSFRLYLPWLYIITMTCSQYNYNMQMNYNNKF